MGVFYEVSLDFTNKDNMIESSQGETLSFLKEVKCEICDFAANPEKFPDIETRSVTKRDFDGLSETSKAILKKFHHDITDFECRLGLYGKIFICPNCGNTEHFNFNAQVG